MHPKEIGNSYDAIAHIWRAPPIQSNGLPQLERGLRFANHCRSGRFALDIGCGCSGRFIDALVRHDEVMIVREQRREIAPSAVRFGKTVKQDHRRLGCIAGGRDVERDPGGQLDARVSNRHWVAIGTIDARGKHALTAYRNPSI